MAGNKSKLTDDFILEASKLVGTGLTNIDVCRVLGISEGTLYRWLGEPRNAMEQKLYESLEKAKGQRKAFHLNNIINAARNGTWQASAWYLERVYPSEFAKPDRYHDQGVDEAIKAVRDLTDEIRKQAKRD